MNDEYERINQAKARNFILGAVYLYIQKNNYILHFVLNNSLSQNTSHI